MEDGQIVEMYWNRLENAITETSQKYEKFCRHIAHRILYNAADEDECINDTYLRTWNSIPPQRPDSLRAYLGRITRNLALNMWEKYNARKRGADMVTLALEELEECIPNTNSMEHVAEQMVLTESLNLFLGQLSKETRVIFMERYWYFASIKEIASKYEMSESKVKMTLHRTREKLKPELLLFAYWRGYCHSRLQARLLNRSTHSRQCLRLKYPHPRSRC